jgi:hypothetical protein
MERVTYLAIYMCARANLAGMAMHVHEQLAATLPPAKTAALAYLLAKATPAPATLHTAVKIVTTLLAATATLAVPMETVRQPVATSHACARRSGVVMRAQ